VDSQIEKKSVTDDQVPAAAARPARGTQDPECLPALSTLRPGSTTDLASRLLSENISCQPVSNS